MSRPGILIAAIIALLLLIVAYFAGVNLGSLAGGSLLLFAGGACALALGTPTQLAAKQHPTHLTSLVHRDDVYRDADGGDYRGGGEDPIKLTYLETTRPNGDLRVVSAETVPGTDHPVLVIDLPPGVPTIVKLGFVRSAPPAYNLARLMGAFHAYAETHYPGITTALEDDALFADKECSFRALTSRLLIGKPSIYERYGYHPDVHAMASCGGDPGYSAENLRTDLDTLKTAPASTWTAVAEYLRMRERTPIELPTLAEGTLGESLAKLSCELKRQAYNDIELASAKACAGVAGDEKVVPFLRAYKRAHRAHNHMTRPHTGHQSSSIDSTEQ